MWSGCSLSSVFALLLLYVLSKKSFLLRKKASYNISKYQIPRLTYAIFIAALILPFAPTPASAKISTMPESFWIFEWKINDSLYAYYNMKVTDSFVQLDYDFFFAILFLWVKCLLIHFLNYLVSLKKYEIFVFLCSIRDNC